ncbi:NADH-cytochrome b5 reductase [Chytriomyces hyalinus]|nr:NADH-cytochrome b5 reductase [Chytriomyces hyalinus]
MNWLIAPLSRSRTPSLRVLPLSRLQLRHNSTDHRWRGVSEQDSLFAKDEKRPKWLLPSLALVSVLVVGTNGYIYYTSPELRNRVPPLEYGEFNQFPLMEVIPGIHALTQLDSPCINQELSGHHTAHQFPDSQSKTNRSNKSEIVLSTNEYVPAPNHIVIKDDSCQVGRSYTPITYGRNHFDLLVKRYDNGSVSSMIHALKPGEDFILARGPILSFPYMENMVSEVVMIAGGTRITPMYQLIKQILRSPTDNTKINLVYGSRTESDILLGHELELLSAKFPDQLRVNHVIQAPMGALAGFGFEVKHTGLINENVLKACGMPKPEEEPLVLVCGPDGMIDALAGEKPSERNQGPLKGVLARMGFSPQQVFKF